MVSCTVTLFCFAGTTLSATIEHKSSSFEYSIGLNKFDFPMQYIGTMPNPTKGEAYQRVSRALARKALADAQDIGVKLLRASVVGFGPVAYGKTGDLDMWRSRPDKFWSGMDVMMDDLDAYEIHLVPVLMWNPGQFPSMTNETISDLISKPDSASWKLLESFVREFITRYRGRRTIVFYELTNELNLMADIDNVARCQELHSKKPCESTRNFSTDDLIAFTRRFADLIRSLDDTRLISSGFSIPRGAAEHLRKRSVGERHSEKWAPDSREEFAKNLREIHQAVDIISIHLYADEKNMRYGSRDELSLLAEAKRVADDLGKPLFVGELGEAKPEVAGPSSFSSRMLKRLVELQVPYSAVWVWEYRQKGYLIQNGRPDGYSLDPGYTNYLIESIREANLGPNSHPRIDRKAPRIVLTWPLECAVLNEQSDFYAVASDDSGTVSKVEFLIDGKVLAVDVSPPYHAVFSPSKFNSGMHRITARAYDHTEKFADFHSHILIGVEPQVKMNCTVSQE